MSRLRRCRHCLLAAAAFALLLLACVLGGGLTRTSQEVDAEEGRRHTGDQDDRRGRRRVLVGPGSSPPTCRGRCGGCIPCRPTHVAVQPGRSIPMEYYPETWRCKCGGKLFMP